MHGQIMQLMYIMHHASTPIYSTAISYISAQDIYSIRFFRNSAAMQKKWMVTCLQMMEEVVSVLCYDIFVCMYFYELLIDVM